MGINEKPIGFWLKEADKAITENVNQNLKQHDLTRFHWQVLNTVNEKGAVSKETIADLLSNFFDASKLNELLNDFIRKNWMIYVENSDPGAIMVQMTEEGKAAFAEIRATQNKTRMQLFEGVTSEEYETTLKVLKQLIDNAQHEN